MKHRKAASSQDNTTVARRMRRLAGRRADLQMVSWKIEKLLLRAAELRKLIALDEKKIAAMKGVQDVKHDPRSTN